MSICQVSTFFYIPSFIHIKCAYNKILIYNNVWAGKHKINCLEFLLVKFLVVRFLLSAFVCYNTFYLLDIIRCSLTLCLLVGALLLVELRDKYGDHPQVCLSCFSHLILSSTSWLAVELADREMELAGRPLERAAAKTLRGLPRIGDTASLLELLGSPQLSLSPK